MLRRMLKFVWVIINIVAGFALGWVITFGFLNLNNQIIIWTVGFIIAVVSGVIWFNILEIGLRNHSDKIFRNIFLIGQSAVFIFLVFLFFSQRLVYQNSPLIGFNYQRSFTKLWNAINLAYPYFEEKNINWDLTYDQYYPLISEVKDDNEYFELVAKMLGSLEDAHTDLTYSLLEKRIYASVINRGDLAIVDQIGYSAEMAGLEPGMLILKVNGISIEDMIHKIDISWNNASTPWAKKIRAYNQLLEVPKNPNDILSLTILDEFGEERIINIRQLTPPDGWIPSSSKQEEVVNWKFIDEHKNIGYIQINQLWNSGDYDIVSNFDAALEFLSDTDGIILDIRQNGGGDSRIAEKIAGRFLDEPFEYGKDVTKKRLYKFAWRKTINYTVKPRGQIYSGKLVVLTDYPVMSSAEWMVGMLVDSTRAISIGRTTGGSTGNPIQFSLPDAKVRYSTAAFYRPNGSLVEGKGYEPIIPTSWSVQDYQMRIDPDIQAAIHWIEHE